MKGKAGGKSYGYFKGGRANAHATWRQTVSSEKMMLISWSQRPLRDDVKDLLLYTCRYFWIELAFKIFVQEKGRESDLAMRSLTPIV